MKLMLLGRQAAIREKIVIDVLEDYLEGKESQIFCLWDAKRLVNLYEQDVEVAIRDLKTQGIIEVAPGYTSTSSPYYQFIEGATPKISTGWIVGQDFWQQRNHNGTVLWNGRDYKIT